MKKLNYKYYVYVICLPRFMKAGSWRLGGEENSFEISKGVSTNE
jgi:hypothetical protein